MANFKISYEKTGGFEGGYSDDPKDSGGETWCGIARNKNPNWPGWIIIDSFKKKQGFPTNLNTSSELKELRLSFYKNLYWDKLRGDELASQEFANMIYGEAVNFGVTRAIKMNQIAAALGPVDISDIEASQLLSKKDLSFGRIDNKTLELFNASKDLI